MTKKHAEEMTTFIHMTIETVDLYDTIFDLMEELNLGTGEDYYSIANCFVSAFKEIVFDSADILRQEKLEKEPQLNNKILYIR